MEGARGTIGAIGRKRRWSQTALLLVAAVPALLIVLTYFPRAFLQGSGPFWAFPRSIADPAFADMAQCFSGYLFYMSAPWAFPLFFASNFGVPDGTNIALMDAVPAVSLIAKILFQVFGLELNLLGVWAALAYLLSGVAFGYVLIRAGVRHTVALAVAIAMVAMWPALLMRISHFPLLAWFTFLLALAGYVDAQRDDARLPRIVALQTAIVAATLFFNIYLAFMAAFFAAVTIVQAVLARRMKPAAAAAFFAGLIAASGMTMLVIGQLSLDGVPAGSGGFGIWSFNLLSPFVPQYSGLFPGANGVDATGGQYEGFTYLGGGTLFLIGAAVWRLVSFAPSRAAVRDGLRRHRVLLVGCAVLTIFAASNRIFLGDLSLVDVPLPWRVTVLLGAFRSSGRYIWPVSMVLLLALFLFWTRCAHVRERTLVTVLATAALLQWIDTRPMRELLYASTSMPARTALNRDTWAELMRQHQFVRVYPTVDCIRAPMSSTQYMNSELQLFAALQRREINIMNTSRPGKDCTREASEMEAATIRPGGLYVFLDWSLRRDHVARREADAACRRFAHGVACTQGWGAFRDAPLMDASPTFYEGLDPVPWQRRRAAQQGKQ